MDSVESIKKMLLDTVAKPPMAPSGCHIDSTSSPIAAPPPSHTLAAAADAAESNPVTPSADPARLAKGSRLVGEWQFESENGWAPMEDTMSTQLEADFESFRKHSLGCHDKCSFAVFKHVCSGYTYEFDLDNMQQRNLRTNKVRRIMRKEAETSETSGAGQSVDFSDLLEEHKDTKLLQFWDRQLIPVRQRNFCYSAVSLEGEEGQGVVTAVSSSLSGAAVPRILAVWRIQNKELMRDFLHFGARLRRELTAEGKGGLLRCASLFHGTRNFGNVDTIAATGFDRNYSAAKDSTTAFGKGAYFAVSAAYSLRGYSCEHQALGGSLLFLANVWVAEHTRGDPSMLNPPFKRSSAFLRYETTVDNVPAPSMHVVYRDGQSYPAYLIHFEGPGSGGPAATGVKPQQITAQKTKPPKNPAVMVCTPNTGAPFLRVSRCVGSCRFRLFRSSSRRYNNNNRSRCQCRCRFLSHTHKRS
jgi:hypothetical protein